MLINGKNFSDIGFIRAKALPGDRWELEIHPPSISPSLAGHGGATLVEIEVSASELRRMVEVAPQLFLGDAPGWPACLTRPDGDPSGGSNKPRSQEAAGAGEQ